MYRQIKYNILHNNKALMIAVLLVAAVLIALFAFCGLYAGIVITLLISALIAAVGRSTSRRFSAMLKALGARSDRDMELILEDSVPISEPTYGRGVDMTFVTEDYIIDFHSLTVFPLRDITEIALQNRSWRNERVYNEPSMLSRYETPTSVSDHRIFIKGTRGRKLTLIYSNFQDRDAAYEKLSAVCAKAGVEPPTHYE